jgi:hypothetical protein
VVRDFTRPVIRATIGTAQRHGGGSVAKQERMRWYNPALGGFEWRDVPGCDEEALSLLNGYPSADSDAAVYEEWRGLGAGILTSLIRAGDVARERREQVALRESARSCVRPRRPPRWPPA